MTFDSLLSSPVSQPLILVVLLLLCVLVAIDALILRHRRRQPLAKVEPLPAGVKQAVDRPDPVVSSDEPARMYPEGLVPLEWDGRPPRPNWNRRGVY
jgi:hypothetical protein